jgi:hypothetical protein
MSELIIVGDGIGVGLGLGVGDGEGLGDCAWAEDVAAPPTASKTAKATAMALAALAGLHPGPVSLARESRDEQHINAISKRSVNPGENAKFPSGRPRFAPSSPGASIGLDPSFGVIAGHCCSAATAGQGTNHCAWLFLRRARRLLRRKFRVAISVTIGFRPIDCAFRD